MHEVHFVTLTVENGRRGWIAPVESANESPQAGSYAVAVDSKGQLFDQYRLPFVKYLGQGKTLPGFATMESQLSGRLKVQINGWSLFFQLRTSEAKPFIHEYVGKLTHPDFGFSLAEIEPESEQQLDDLYTRDQIVLVGCDPVESYGGMESTVLPSKI